VGSSSLTSALPVPFDETQFNTTNGLVFESAGNLNARNASTSGESAEDEEGRRGELR
jgi:hypothetical protein